MFNFYLIKFFLNKWNNNNNFEVKFNKIILFYYFIKNYLNNVILLQLKFKNLFFK